MYIIVGLGNPGREYEGTRHNVGFLVLDKLAAKENISILEKRHKAIIGKGMAAGQKCVLAKPQTYMNLSGECVRQLIDFYKADETTELIVISDDVSLEVGQIRIRKKGSAGGHNGLKNIIAHLGHDGFIRVKMGVGEKPSGWDLVDYVLGRFSPKDREAMDEAAGRAADAIRTIIAQGPDVAMNQFNTVKKPVKEPKEPKGPREPKEPKEPKEPREPKEPKQPKEQNEPSEKQGFQKPEEAKQPGEAGGPETGEKAAGESSRL